MKKIKNIILAFILAAGSVLNIGTSSVQAATKEDVIAAARQAGLSESYVQQGINMLESASYSAEAYDQMVGAINNYSGNINEAVKNQLENNGSAQKPSEPSAPVTNETPEKETSSESSQTADAQTSQNTQDAQNNQTPAPNSPAPSAPVKNFSEMTESEKDEYVANLTPAEKTQMIKDLDRDTQMQIINSLIDASAGLGLNVTVDSLTKDKIEYSVVNNNGDVVDIASMGNIVDDTGIDYTALIIAALSVILISAGGITLMAAYNRR